MNFGLYFLFLYWIVAYFCSTSTSPHINQRPSSPSRSLGVGFPLPSNSHIRATQTNIHLYTYTLTQQDPEVRLSHCPCTHKIACQFRLSALFTACFRSFYFRSGFFFSLRLSTQTHAKLKLVISMLSVEICSKM